MIKMTYTHPTDPKKVSRQWEFCERTTKKGLFEMMTLLSRCREEREQEKEEYERGRAREEEEDAGEPKETGTSLAKAASADSALSRSFARGSTAMRAARWP